MATLKDVAKETTNMIGVIVPHIRHPYFAELISNLESQAEIAESRFRDG